MGGGVFKTKGLETRNRPMMSRRKSTHGRSLQLAFVAYMSPLAAMKNGNQVPAHSCPRRITHGLLAWEAAQVI